MLNAVNTVYKTQIGACIAISLAEKIDMLARESSTSRSAIVEMILRQYVNTIRPATPAGAIAACEAGPVGGLAKQVGDGRGKADPLVGLAKQVGDGRG